MSVVNPTNLSVALFVANGLIEGLMLGGTTFVNPFKGLNMLDPRTAERDDKEIHYDGYLMAEIMAPSMLAFGLGSIVMAKVPESKAKTVFASAWLFYHAYQSQRLARDLLRDDRGHFPQIVAMHSLFAVGFLAYLKKNFQFEIMSLK